jgi:DNA repair protein RecO (recombination protein O)
MELLSAYVLHTRPWRDNSLLVDVLLQQGYRVRGIARGQRKQSGRNKGTVCQPFRPLLIAVAGKSELKTIIHLDADGPAFALPGDRLYAGFYANEILLRALPEADPHPPLFIAYRHLLAALVDRQLDIEPPLRRFELTLLNELGYGIDFYHDARSGEALRSGANYAFVAETGFVELDARQLRDHGNVYSGSHLLQVGQGQIESGAGRTVAKQLMRQALRPLLGNKPLQCRMLYRPAGSIKSR